jgi:hypothetical protein
MSLSSYPNGFKNGQLVKNVRVPDTVPGNVFWVDSGSGADSGRAGLYNYPFASLDYAVGKCTASNGDIIYIKPGHAETLSSATALALDVAGITVVGLGAGTLKPTFTLDTATTTTIAVSGANTVLQNLKFSANFADIADLFTPSSTNFKLVDCDFVATATNMNFVEIVDTGTTNNECDGLEFHGCSWIEPDTATTSLLNVDGDLDGLKVSNCYFNLGVNTSDLPIIAVVATGKDLSNAEIIGNRCVRLNDANPLLITADTTTANTGVIARNHVRHLDTAAELLVTAGTNFGFFENYATAAVDKSGYILPAVDS